MYPERSSVGYRNRKRLLPNLLCSHDNPCGIQYQNDAAISHDGGTEKVGVVLQAAAQRLHHDLFFADQAIHNQAISTSGRFDQDHALLVVIQIFPQAQMFAQRYDWASAFAGVDHGMITVMMDVTGHDLASDADAVERKNELRIPTLGQNSFRDHQACGQLDYEFCA